MASRPTSRLRGLALALLAGLGLTFAVTNPAPAQTAGRPSSPRPAPTPAPRPAPKPGPWGSPTPAPKPNPKPGPWGAPKPNSPKGWPSPVVKCPRPHIPTGLSPTWGSLYRRLPGRVAERGWYGRFSKGYCIPCNYPYWTHRTYCTRYRVEMCYDQVTRGWYYRSARYGCFVPYSCVVALEQQCVPSPYPTP